MIDGSALPLLAKILNTLAAKKSSQKTTLSLSGFAKTRAYVGNAPTKCANKPIARFTNGASKNSHTPPLTINRSRQKISKAPNVFDPFQKLTKHMAAFPASKIPANTMDAVLPSLTNTPAKLLAASSNQTTLLKILGAYLPCSIWCTPTAYDAVPRKSMAK